MIVDQARCPCKEAPAEEGGPHPLQLRLRKVELLLETGRVQAESVGGPRDQLQCACTTSGRPRSGQEGGGREGLAIE